MFPPLTVGDNNWYRAVVLEIGKEEISVLYADYGNTEKLPFSRIAPIPKNLLELPFQIIRCALVGEGWGGIIYIIYNFLPYIRSSSSLLFLAFTSFLCSQAMNPSLQSGQRKCWSLLKGCCRKASLPPPFTLTALPTCCHLIRPVGAASARSWLCYELNLMISRHSNRPLMHRPSVG